MSSALTCNSCNERFNDEPSQRDHYRSEWHRYNLKRKVAGLPGVTSQWFDRRQEALSQKPEPENRETFFRCHSCRKDYTSSKSYENHLKSKSHQSKPESSDSSISPEVPVTKKSPIPPQEISTVPENLSQIDEEDSEEEEWEEIDEAEAEQLAAGPKMEDSEAEELWEIERCFFCTEASEFPSFEDCLEHMHKHHGFFIPDSEFLAKPKELLQYLALKVTKGLLCLFCEAQFESVEAVRQHMVSKCHSKMNWDESAEEEYEEFFDYPENVSEGEGEMGGPYLALSASGTELVVRGSSRQAGKVLGAREMARFYKQKFRASEGREGVLVNALLAKYRSLGLSTRESRWSVRKNLDSGVKSAQRAEAMRTKLALKNNVIRILPKNCTY